MSGATLNVAILGAGIGAQHLAAYQALPERFAVTMLCDRDRERARLVAGETDIVLSDTVETAISDPAIDLIDICLPPHLHFPVAMSALQAGKHVVCEKPLVRSLAEVDQLESAARAAGRRIFPVFQYRYGPATRQIRALIDAGLAGQAYAASLETHWNRGASYYAVPWRGTWSGENGGAVLGHAIHNHDLLCHVLGPIASLSAQTATRVNAIETEDCAAIAMVMQNGALATSSITLGAADNTTRLRFCFEGLTAESGSAPYAPAEDRWRFIARDPVQQEDIDAVVAERAPGPSGFTGYFEAVADALAGHAGREVTLADGRRSIELVTAVYQSARTGQPVALPLDRQCDLYGGWLP